MLSKKQAVSVLFTVQFEYNFILTNNINNPALPLENLFRFLRHDNAKCNLSMCRQAQLKDTLKVIDRPLTRQIMVTLPNRPHPDGRCVLQQYSHTTHGTQHHES